MESFITTTDIADGSIVVAACKDECATFIKSNALKWFHDMGSKELCNIQFRQSFAFIGIMGKKEGNEKRAER